MSLLQIFRKNHKRSTEETIRPQSTRELGFDVEAQAIAHLQKAGYDIVATNYTVRRGEIDIIACKQQLLLFVEVRYRSSEHFGGAIASVTKTKQRRILAAIRHFIAVNKQFANFNLRIDLMAFNSKNSPVNWIENAFTEGDFFI